MKKTRIGAMALVVLWSAILLLGCGGGESKKEQASGANGDKLVIYTSMKDSLIKGIVEGFKKSHPGIAVEYKSAGAGKLMANIADERKNGEILADIIWTSEVPDFYNMKKEGMLEIYKSPMVKETINPLEDYDGSFSAARLGTLGIAINTDKVKTPPTKWSDLLKPEYKGAFAIADPAQSGTAYMSIALLEKKFGWGFFEQLRDNQAKIGKGSGQVIDDTVSGELSACLAVDYVAHGKIEKGEPIALYYPAELLVVPSPVAILKSTKNLGAAQKFVDYLLGVEAQTLIAAEGTISVRPDVNAPDKYKLPKAKDALESSIKMEYYDILATKAATTKRFADILNAKQ